MKAVQLTQSVTGHYRHDLCTCTYSLKKYFSCNSFFRPSCFLCSHFLAVYLVGLAKGHLCNVMHQQYRKQLNTHQLSISSNRICWIVGGLAFYFLWTYVIHILKSMFVISMYMFCVVERKMIFLSSQVFLLVSRGMHWLFSSDLD